MVATVLEIVNAARQRAGLGKTALSASSFDAVSNQTKDITTVKAEFSRLYKELALMKKEDFRKVFAVTTVANNNQYSLSFDFSMIYDCDLRMQEGVGISPRRLEYRGEDEVLAMYPDLDRISSGTPSIWFVQTTPSQGIKYLSFINKPDKAYTIEGIQSLRAEVLTASQATRCNQEGDLWLEDRLYERILFADGLAPNTTDLSHKSRMRYLMTSQRQEHAGGGVFPLSDACGGEMYGYRTY